MDVGACRSPGCASTRPWAVFCNPFGVDGRWGLSFPRVREYATLGCVLQPLRGKYGLPPVTLVILSPCHPVILSPCHQIGGTRMVGSLKEIVAGFAGKRVLVVGDLMLDEYIWGDVRRISPEAPVPVV